MLDNGDYVALFGKKNSIPVPGIFATFFEAFKTVSILFLITVLPWYTVYLGFMFIVSLF